MCSLYAHGHFVFVFWMNNSYWLLYAENALILVVILAYADDLRVFARSYEDACRMTRFIIEEYASIGLTIRASKCAVLSENMQPITTQIDGSIMIIYPTLTEKYLRVDVDHNGINWRVYYDRVLANHKNHYTGYLFLKTHGHLMLELLLTQPSYNHN